MGDSSDGEEDVNCKKCSKLVQENDQGIFCEGKCQSWYHIRCMGITTQQYKKISGVTEIMIWMCISCKKDLKEFMSTKRSNYEECLDKLVQKVNSIEEKLAAVPRSFEENLSIHSYASITQSSNKRTVHRNLPTIIIKPKKTQNIGKTRDDLEKKLNPGNIGVKINAKRELQNGNIILKCPTMNDVEKLKKSAMKSLGQNYEIMEKSLRNPRIKIPGLEHDYTKEQLEEAIKSQNEHISDGDHLKITYIKSNRIKKNKTAFAECSPELFHKLLNNKKIYIGWQRYPVYEDISVLRCFKCQQFHHKNIDCKNKTTCAKCSEEHETKDCDNSILKCMNCDISNNKFSTEHDINHAANDIKCPCYVYQLNIVKTKINYG